MSKRVVILLSLIILVVIFSFCYLKNINKGFSYKVIDSGYVSDFDNLVISNISDYNKFVNEFGRDKLDIDNSKYNKSYFKNKSLCVINVTLGSSAYKIANIEIGIVKNTLMVSLDINKPNGMVTMDMSGKIILVDVSKEVTNVKVKEVSK